MIGLPLVLAFAAGAAAHQSRPASLPHVITERTIPSLTRPEDVRWLDDQDVILADVMRGIARIPAADPAAPLVWLDEWPRPTSPGALYHRLAMSEKYILTADLVFTLRWRGRNGDTRLQTMVFELINDVDLAGDRILILGSRRDETGKLAEGIAWLGLLSDTDSLRPILPLRNRYAITDCSLAGLGSARFLKDGSFVVVPGAESGIYLFKANGTLDRVWQSNDLGVEINCEFDKAHGNLIRMQSVARQEWVNRQQAMVDEIIDTPGGPALIVRKVSDGLTQWDMLLLNGPSPKAQKLPFTSPSPWAHISAASRGDRIVFLIGDRLENRKDGAPARLILADWKSH